MDAFGVVADGVSTAPDGELTENEDPAETTETTDELSADFPVSVDLTTLTAPEFATVTIE